MEIYTNTELAGIYELGKMYYEMGFYTAAERIFQGLLLIDQGSTPSRIGLGLIKLENGLLAESVTQFREAIKASNFETEAKVGLSLCFIAEGQHSRAHWLFNDVAMKNTETLTNQPLLKRFVECLTDFCTEIEKLHPQSQEVAT